MFIVGVSLVFSLGRTIEREGRAAALKRVFWRTLLMFAVGLFYSGGFSSRWPDIRLLGVLNRIALCYGFTGVIYCCVGRRGMAILGVELLAGYWALMTFVSFPEIGRASCRERVY